MQLEIWIVVGAGVAFAVGFVAVTVLLLGLHAEIRRLCKLAEAAQRVLVDNLKQALPSTTTRLVAAAPPEPAAAEVKPVAGPSEVIPLALAKLAVATNGARPPSLVESPPGSAPSSPAWHPDRKLLVMRLASRGKEPDQIAAALHIPQAEVEEFLEFNRLVVQKFVSPTPSKTRTASEA